MSICALGGHGCPAHAYCIVHNIKRKIQPTYYRCDCRGGYEKKNGICEKEEDSKCYIWKY